MTKQKQESIRKREKLVIQTDKRFNKSLIIGCIIATFLAISPYLFYLYESVPNEQIWDTFLFTYDAKSWEEANFAMWVLTGKLLPLIFLLIWFFTCRHWWYHALLVPITMYIYQIFGIFNENISYIDEFQLMHLVPVMAIVIPSIYLLRARIFNTINAVSKTTQDLEDELRMKPKGIWSKFKQYF